MVILILLQKDCTRDGPYSDGGNDIEMLKLAKYSYAMANAPKNVKAAANYQAKSNDESGVLDVIDNYLASID